MTLLPCQDVLPLLAKEYGFEYELVQYKWPRWLHQQSEKQRIIWGYKILFLDVLFPLDIKKIIFVDADQVIFHFFCFCWFVSDHCLVSSSLVMFCNYSILFVCVEHLTFWFDTEILETLFFYNIFTLICVHFKVDLDRSSISFSKGTFTVVDSNIATMKDVNNLTMNVGYFISNHSFF